MTPEEAQATGHANQMIENNLSSVKIIHKTDLKTGKERTEWEIKVKDESAFAAAKVAQIIDEELRDKYGN